MTDRTDVRPPAAPGDADAGPPGRALRPRGAALLAGADWRGRAVRRQESAVMVALVLLVTLFWALRPDQFGSAGNISNLCQDASILLILCVGVTFVTVMGCFDLSIGSVLVFSQVLAVKAMGVLGGQGVDVAAAGLLVSLAVGTTWGLVNGWLIAHLHLSPFIVTLASAGAAFGAAQLVSGGSDATTIPVDLTDWFGLRQFLGVPYLVWVAAVVAVVGGVVLAQTRFGRRTYAIGSNQEAVRRAGVDTARHVVTVYALMGLLAGLAGFLSAAHFGTTSLNGHANDALAAITAVALGGASLYGGIGTILGTVIGVSIPAVLQNGLVILNSDPYWNQIIVAVALVASVHLDRRRRFAEQRGTGTGSVAPPPARLAGGRPGRPA